MGCSIPALTADAKPKYSFSSEPAFHITCPLSGLLTKSKVILLNAQRGELARMSALLVCAYLVARLEQPPLPTFAQEL
jgi:hypothetical protein